MTRRAGRRLTERRRRRRMFGSQLQIKAVAPLPPPSTSIQQDAPRRPHGPAPSATRAFPVVPLIEGWPTCGNCGAPTACRHSTVSRPSNHSQEPPRTDTTKPSLEMQGQMKKRPKSPPPIIALPRNKPLKLVRIDIPDVDWRWYRSLPANDPRHTAWRVLRLFGTGAADPPTTGKEFETRESLIPDAPRPRTPPPPLPKFSRNVIANRPAITTLPSSLGKQWLQSRSRLDLSQEEQPSPGRKCTKPTSASPEIK